MLSFFQRKFAKYNKKKLEQGVKKNVYQSLQASQDFHLIARACNHFARALLNKDKLVTAFIGSSALSRMESLQDCGFCLQHEEDSFFGDKSQDMFGLYNPIESFRCENFDVALIIEENQVKKNKIKEFIQDQKKCLIFDLNEMARLFRLSLNSIQSKNFISCLNLHKLAVIFLCTYLCPTKRNIAEIGAYQCGTTLFMAKLIQNMKKECHVFAFDTFVGMPKASQNDKSGVFCFDEGMFCDNEIEKVKKRLLNEKVHSHITLCKGLVQEVLPQVISKKNDLFFAFIDTDQYAGTSAGLQNVLQALPKDDFLIVVDDPIVQGVNHAIEDVLNSHKGLIRKRIFTNFELIFSKRFSTI